MNAGAKFFQTVAASLLATGPAFGGFAEFNHTSIYRGERGGCRADALVLDCDDRGGKP